MKSDKKRVVRRMALLLGALMLCLPWLASLSKRTVAGAPAETVELPAGGVVRDDVPDDGVLGIAKHFHIFSREAELGAHTNGNIATGNLIAPVNFGTNVHGGELATDIHYLQHVTEIASSAFVESSDTRGLKVVLGEGVMLGLANNGETLTVNGTRLDHVDLKPVSEAFMDRSGQTYVDFDAEFAALRTVSQNLSAHADTPGVVKDFADMNARTIDVSGAEHARKASVTLTKTDEKGKPLAGATFDLRRGTETVASGLVTDARGRIVLTDALDAGHYAFVETAAPEGYVLSEEPVTFTVTDADLAGDGFTYVTVTKEELERETPLYIRGLSEARPSVIFNVDMQGADEITIRSQTKPFIDGTERQNKETEYFGDATFMWNFPNTTKKVVTDRPFQGTVLATGAFVQANYNLDGSLIADRVKINGGESHRWDFRESAQVEGKMLTVTATNRLETTPEPTTPTETTPTETSTEPTSSSTTEVTTPTETTVTSTSSSTTASTAPDETTVSSSTTSTTETTETSVSTETDETTETTASTEPTAPTETTVSSATTEPTEPTESTSSDTEDASETVTSTETSTSSASTEDTTASENSATATITVPTESSATSETPETHEAPQTGEGFDGLWIFGILATALGGGMWILRRKQTKGSDA